MGSHRTTLLQAIAEASGGALSLTRAGSGWPAEGDVRLGSGSAKCLLYVGRIGESHRDRDSERRFQNPSTDKPIEPRDGALSLLLGVEEGTQEERDPLVVAMDAYRRAGLRTRFSMFMPAALMRAAADSGYAEHTTESGEVLCAFRASRLSTYLSKLVDTRGARLDWLEPGFRGRDEPASSPRLDDQEAGPQNTLHIRPKVGMYAAFARLNYKPWFAIAEFVDNSVQSYLANRTRMPLGPLEVEIRFDEDEIVISDKAAGIALTDFPRAFSPSHPPPDATGLSEFGLGMKAAACWFSRYWTVRTSALGDATERLVRFDVDRVTADGIEHLPIETRPSRPEDHFTVITLRRLRVRPQKRTLGKIKEHLASIYRVLMDKGLVRIRVVTMTGATELHYERPPLLNAPSYREPDGAPRLWRSEFEFTLDHGKRVWGWAGLLERGSGSHAGFGVFRRDRLIQGSGDETYRPLRLFRNPNTFTYQRLVGELFVEGFDVSHTKDGIQWGGYEDDVLSLLHKHLSSPENPILSQAEGFRVKQRARDLPKSFGAEAVQGAAAELEAASCSDLLAPLPQDAEVAGATPSVELPPGEVAPALIHQRYDTSLTRDGGKLSVRLELIRDPTAEWYGFSAGGRSDDSQIEVWINLAHPFSESYVNSDENTLGPLVRLVTALAFAENAALQEGVRRAPAIRVRANELLRRFGTEKAAEGEAE